MKSATGRTSRGPVIFDEQQALAAAGGDLDVLREITGLFLSDLPRRLLELREAVSTGALDKVALVAHALRGSAAVFGSDLTVEAAFQLERLAKEGNRNALPSAVEKVEGLVHQLAKAVATRLIDGTEPALELEKQPALRDDTGASLRA